MNLKSESISRHQAGQALTMVTLGTVLVFGILGIAVEVGHSHYLKRVTQAAATSAVDGSERELAGRQWSLVPGGKQRE